MEGASDGLYRIAASGAQGGGSNAGSGAVITASLRLTAGTWLKILVGQSGARSPGCAALPPVVAVAARSSSTRSAARWSSPVAVAAVLTGERGQRPRRPAVRGPTARPRSSFTTVTRGTTLAPPKPGSAAGAGAAAAGGGAGASNSYWLLLRPGELYRRRWRRRGPLGQRGRHECDRFLREPDLRGRRSVVLSRRTGRRRQLVARRRWWVRRRWWGRRVPLRVRRLPGQQQGGRWRWRRRRLLRWRSRQRRELLEPHGERPQPGLDSRRWWRQLHRSDRLIRSPVQPATPATAASPSPT